MSEENLRISALRAEILGNWKEAAQLWRECGELEEAKACQLIHDAISKGDQFRSLVNRRLQTEEQHCLACTSCPTFLTKILNECHKEVYD